MCTRVDTCINNHFSFKIFPLNPALKNIWTRAWASILLRCYILVFVSIYPAFFLKVYSYWFMPYNFQFELSLQQNVNLKTSTMKRIHPRLMAWNKCLFHAWRVLHLKKLQQKLFKARIMGKHIIILSQKIHLKILSLNIFNGIKV